MNGWWGLLFKRVRDRRKGQASMALVVLAALFFALSFLIHQPQVISIDFGVTHWVQSHRSPVLDDLARGVTILGNTVTLLIFAALTAVGLYRAGRRREAVMVLLSLLGMPLSVAMKGMFERPRPDASVVEVLGPTFGLSFPSGHAMGSTMFYGFLAVLTWVFASAARQRVYGVVGFGATVLLICLSRIYLGAHWLSDVVAGVTAGLFFLVLLVLVYRWGAKDGTRTTDDE